MREVMNADIRTCCRQLFLSGAIPDLCEQEGTPKQVEFILKTLQNEMELRKINKRKRLMKQAGFPRNITAPI